jgi:thiamine kinase-like enzyme
VTEPQLRDALRALAAHLGVEPGVPEPLSGGITNRNYRVRAGGHDLVVRCPGDGTGLLGIDRTAEHEASVAAAAAGVGPEVVVLLQPGGCLVTRFLPGRQPTPEEVREPHVLARGAAALRAVHAGPPLRATFSPFAVGEDYRRVAVAQGATLPPAAALAEQVAAEIRPLLTGPEHEPVPCHNDLLAANLLLDGERVRILDWEYAGMGDRYFDLANLAVNNSFTADDDARLLEAYFGPAGATALRVARLRLMRLMSDYREAMWGVVQGAVSTLDVDFAAYADEHFERLRAAVRRPDHADILRAAMRR